MEKTARYIAQLLVASRWVRHGLFWFAFVLFSTISALGYFDTTAHIQHFIGGFVLQALVVYSAYFIYLLAKKYDSIILFLVGTIAISSPLASILACKWYLVFNPADDKISMWNFYSYYIFLSNLTATLKFAKDMYVWQQEEFLRKQQQSETELTFLKAQISPHFLFNTLNNLYGHAVTKSDLLPDMMLRLSDLLRYTIYDTSKPFVPLHDELDYIRNYVALEKMRLSKESHIEIDIQQDISPDLQIAPLILICFVENAFKHSRHVIGNQLRIKGKIAVQQNTLLMEIENSFNPEVKETTLVKREGGVGMEIVRKRLALVYPERHELKNEERNGIYYLTLRIQL